MSVRSSPACAVPAEELETISDDARELVRLRSAIEHMPVGFCMLDANDRLQLWNERFAELWCLPERLRQVGTSYAQLVTAGGGYEVTHPSAVTHPPGTPGSRRREWNMPDGRVLEVFVDLQANGSCVAIHEDVTERRESERRVAWLASHDTLTRLANRSALRATLDDADERPLAVLLLDLDRFKRVNDSFGHAVGDELLRAAARRIVDCCDPEATIARLGGDEFAIVALDPEEGAAATRLAERIAAALAEPFDLQGRRVQIGASVGVATAPRDGRGADALLQRADLAMYLAKASRRSNVFRFEPEMEARAIETRTLESDLRAALERGELSLAFQPQVDLHTTRACGVEALLRWQHPELGTVSPERFVPIAEESGLIVPMGRWVLAEACRVAASWSRPLRIAVNVSAAQFGDGSLLEDVVHALETSGLEPTRLEIEITESVVMEDEATAREVLLELRARGVRLAMDDFGTGHSSLSHLRRLPFDRLKIDRSFVRDLDAGADALAVVRSVAALGTGLGMSVTVEGVETPEQLAIVRREGCHEAQGYLFGRPSLAGELPAVIARIDREASLADMRDAA